MRSRGPVDDSNIKGLFCYKYILKNIMYIYTALACQFCTLYAVTKPYLFTIYRLIRHMNNSWKTNAPQLTTYVLL